MTSTSTPSSIQNAPPPAPRLSARSTRLPLASLASEPCPFHALTAAAGSASPSQVKLPLSRGSPSAPLLASVMTRRTPPQAARYAPHSPNVSPELSLASSPSCPVSSPPSPSLSTPPPPAPSPVTSRHVVNTAVSPTTTTATTTTTRSPLAVVQMPLSGFVAPPSPSLSVTSSRSPSPIASPSQQQLTARPAVQQQQQQNSVPAPELAVDHAVPLSMEQVHHQQQQQRGQKRGRSPSPEPESRNSSPDSRRDGAPISTSCADDLYAVPCLEAMAARNGSKRARTDALTTSRVEFRVITVLRQSVALVTYRDHDVAHIKSLLAPATGMPVEAIAIVLNGRELDDDLTVRQAGIETGSILLARFKRSAARYSILAKSLSGSVLARFELTPQETVMSLKDMIACKTSLSTSRMMLMHSGKTLSCDKTCLEDTCLPTQATVLVLPK